MSDTSIAARIWSLCHVLRDDGIVYHKYLSELTYLIFLKTASETGAESALPEGCRWDDLLGQPDKGLLSFYRKMLTRLGEDADDENVRAIFSFPTTVFSHDENLAKVVNGIQSLDWHSAAKDGLGTIYEALLERNATEARSGAGQYFTPRALVDSMVRLLAPGPGDTIQDPSAGTGGFLISAHEFIREKFSRKMYAANPPTFSGIEIEHDTYRLCLMNIFLHQMNGQIVHGDALTDDAKGLVRATVVIANPPFGTTAGGARPRRQDLPFPTGNKQLLFLQHIYLSLAPGGRAAVVVPDNVISDDGIARKVRDDLMDRCNLHTVLRLPEGLFYAASVKTNVLFFSNDLSEFSKLRSRSSIRNRISAFLDAFEQLDANERSEVRTAIDDENKLSQLFRNELDCLRKDQLPEKIRGPAEDLFTKLFEILTDLGVRDAQYTEIYNAMKTKICPFCGCEYFDPLPLPRHDLDHYLPRTIYPFAASNLNNLAPMGDRCNKSYKKRIDMLRNDAGIMRKCSDPFEGPIASISLLRSVPLQRDDGRLPIWHIDIIEDSEELRTWDTVFQIRERYTTAVLDQEYQGWLSQFARWSLTQSVQNRANPRGLLETYVAQLEPEGISERVFLKRAVFNMLRDRCDDVNLGADIIAHLTDVINVYV